MMIGTIVYEVQSYGTVTVAALCMGGLIFGASAIRLLCWWIRGELDQMVQSDDDDHVRGEQR